MASRRRDNRLAPSPRQRERWSRLPGMAPHGDLVEVPRDSWTGLPAAYRHARPEDTEPLRRSAAQQLLIVWTVDPNAPDPDRVHLNRYVMTAAQAIELIGGAARGRWIEEVIHIEPAPPSEPGLNEPPAP